MAAVQCSIAALCSKTTTRLCQHAPSTLPKTNSSPHALSTHTPTTARLSPLVPLTTRSPSPADPSRHDLLMSLAPLSTLNLSLQLLLPVCSRPSLTTSRSRPSRLIRHTASLILPSPAQSLTPPSLTTSLSRPTPPNPTVNLTPPHPSSLSARLSRRSRTGSPCLHIPRRTLLTGSTTQESRRRA